MTKANKSAAVVRKWKRIMAVGCSHGDLIDPEASAQVLKFRERWKPDAMIHLGDFVDTAAFRSGAKGSSDESRAISPDMNAGLEFLNKLRPTLVIIGNHEVRPWKLQYHHSAIVAECARGLVKEIRETCKSIKAELVEKWNVVDAGSYRTFGGYKFMHGFFFNESGTRDHAEAFGNCVHAHTHRAAFAKGRRNDNPSGYCVGTLTNIPNMDYAGSRRATMAWSHGFVWGEYCDDQATLWLHENQKGQAWRLPI